MGNVGIHVVEGDGCRDLVRPGEEELQVAGVVQMDGSLRAPAA